MNKKSKLSAEIFRNLCFEFEIPFHDVASVRSYDETTLFCPAGMQQFKSRFIDESYRDQTVANIQSCLRLTDLIQIGDGTHSIVFRMIGLFSFRDWSVKSAIEFFHRFIGDCGLTIAYVTVHPDKMDEWRDWHPIEIEVRPDFECQWSDGNVGGYCTEFYVLDDHSNAVEIGNIVNPLGTCIDVGFGADRIDQLMLKSKPRSEVEELKSACDALISDGFVPSPNRHGYILRKLLRILDKKGGELNHPYFYVEKSKRQDAIIRYNRLLPKNLDKSQAWWKDTHGIDPLEF